MNISSYNITDVSYHYIGLRVLDGIPASSGRVNQTETISRNVLKLVTDRALRLMLPEPRGTFSAVGTKVCQELVHLGMARSIRSSGYELTDLGRDALNMLNTGKGVELRRLMVSTHLRTYDNLRAILQTHLDMGYIMLPVVEARRLGERDYYRKLLQPTLGAEATVAAVDLTEDTRGKIENALHTKIIGKVTPETKISLPIFRSISDRLSSMRLLNTRRTILNGCQFVKSYSPCLPCRPSQAWYTPLKIDLPDETGFTIYLCEPNAADASYQEVLLKTIDQSLVKMSIRGGYYDIPELRDSVCESLLIPEATFDEGLTSLLDTQPHLFSVGLGYDGISANRKPIIRNSNGASQVTNLIRRL